MKRGICKLCLLEKDLVKSHLIPAAMFDYCTPPGGHPIAMTSEIVMESDRQVQAPLLCAKCEENLNKGGETWLLPLLLRYEGAFPFYDLLTAVPAEGTDAGATLFAAARNPEIRCDELMHFAMGVFWKAAVHSWRGNQAETMINLGRYAEPIRRFLRSEQDFPNHMALRIGVLPPSSQQISFHTPYRGSSRECHNFLFYVSGIEFTLLVGKAIDASMREASFSGNALRLMVVADFSPAIRSIMSKMWVRARKAKNVEKYLKHPPIAK